MALDTMDFELNELVELMNKARINVKDDLARREEVWDIPEEIPQQNFSINKWMRLKNLNDKYFGTNDEGLKKIEEAILWKSKKMDYKVKDTVRFVQMRMMPIKNPRSCESLITVGFSMRSFYLHECSKTLDMINENFNNKLKIMDEDLLKETRQETAEQIRAEIAKVEKIKQDHKRMVEDWIEVQNAVIMYGYDCYGRAEPAYNSLHVLEEKYKEYNDGQGLENLEIARAYLEIPKLKEKNLQERLDEGYDSYGFSEPDKKSLRVLEEKIVQERLDEANSKGSGEVAKRNGERNMAEAGKEIKGRSSSERDGR